MGDSVFPRSRPAQARRSRPSFSRIRSPREKRRRAGAGRCVGASAGAGHQCPAHTPGSPRLQDSSHREVRAPRPGHAPLGAWPARVPGQWPLSALLPGSRHRFPWPSCWAGTGCVGPWRIPVTCLGVRQAGEPRFLFLDETPDIC